MGQSTNEKAAEKAATDRRVSLAAKFGLLLAVILVVLLALQIGWSYYTRTQQAQSQMLTRVQDIASEVGSVLRSTADTDDEARASIVRNFIVDMAGDSETGISLVRLDGGADGASSSAVPSSGFESLLESPDDFEQEAIAALQTGADATSEPDEDDTSDAGSSSGDGSSMAGGASSSSGSGSALATDASNAYFRLTTVNGMQVFRYVTLVEAGASNGEAQGSGAGASADASGAGSSSASPAEYAVSVWIPADNYLGRVWTDALGDVSLSGLVILAALAVILAVTRKLITQPVAAMDAAAGAIASHDFDVRVESKPRHRDELDELADHLNDMAAELKGLYTDLEGQVSARTNELSEANARLEEQSEQLRKANRELREDNEYRVKFLSVMSHELRTPLTSILAFLDIWEREQGPRNEAEAQMMREIRINGKLLLDRVNNILEVSRIDAGRSRMEWEAVDPFDLAAQLRATMAPLAENAGLDLQVAADDDVPLIWGDSEKLLRILENLTTNAVKYTDRGGWVHVRIAYDQAANAAVFTVADDGRGIDAESQAHIFEGFVQARGASAHISEGSGLGLAVVRELAQMHGGSVAVKSPTVAEPLDAAGGPVRKGTTFTVRIPCGEVQ